MNKYYNQINEVLISYEEHKSYHTKNISWACNRIDWCWKWRKITEDQMNELADRATAILRGEI